MFACVAGAGLLAEDELALELVLWLDCVDVFELLDDLHPITAAIKRMKAIACARFGNHSRSHEGHNNPTTQK